MIQLGNRKVAKNDSLYSRLPNQSRSISLHHKDQPQVHEQLVAQTLNYIEKVSNRFGLPSMIAPLIGIGFGFGLFVQQVAHGHGTSDSSKVLA